jgi:general secretion pathway protein I
LIEVLVAFTVLAISLGVLFQIFSTGMGTSRSAEEYTRATLLAESKLATVGITGALEEGETTGEYEDGYAWHLNIRPYRLDGQEAEGLAPPIEAYEVVVTVAWGQGSRARSVSLTTLRLKSAAAPGTRPAP